MNGYSTVTPDVGDARNRVRHNVYDIIISEYDLGKGERTGQQFLEELRIEQTISAATGFIITTTEGERSKVLSTLEYRPDEYILKPFREAEIGNRLVSTIEKKVFFSNVYNLIFKEEYEKAIQELGFLSKINKYPLDIIRLKLVCFLKKGSYQNVIDMYEEIISHKTLHKIAQFPWFRYSYSKALYHLGRFQEAEHISAELKRKYPEYMENYKLLVDILHSQKKDEESFDVLKLAVSLSPLNMERQVLLGKKALQAGDTETAMNAHKTVIEKGSNSCLYTMDTHANMAHIYGELGQFDEALNILNDGVSSFAKTDPMGSKFTCAVMESQIYAKKGDEVQAKSAFDYALQVFQEQGGTGFLGLNVSDDVKLFFSAECLENGYEEIAQGLIAEVMEKGNHRDDQLETQLKKTLRTPEKQTQITSVIGNIKQENAPSIYDKIAGDEVSVLSQKFKLAMDEIDEGNFHQAAQLLEQIVDGYPLDETKTSYQNAFEVAKNGDWKMAISLLKLENLKNKNDPRTYFDLAQISFFYMNSNILQIEDGYVFDKMFFQAQSYFQRGENLLTPETQILYKAQLSTIRMIMDRLLSKKP